jgi:hypothetical protein
MMKNYYPRLKSVAGKLVMAVASTFMVFNSESSIAQGLTSSSYSAVPGTTVTLTGSGFNILPGANSVFFGGAKANILSATATELGVTVPVGASYDRIRAANNTTPYGWVGTTSPFSPLFNNCYVAGSNSFKPKVDFTTGTEPYAAAFADLDGDGKLDMVVANHGAAAASSITIFRNTSVAGTINASSFAAGATFNAGAAGPSNIKFADLDRDGKQDMIVSFNGSGVRITLFRNISTVGSIAFGTGRVLAINGGNPAEAGKCSESTIADFDGDGKPDIAAVVRATNTAGSTSTGNDSVRIFRNLITTPPGAGAGFTGTSFASSVSFALPLFSEPSSIATADFDGDGSLDIVTANQAASYLISFNCISVFRNISTSGNIALSSRIDLPTPYNSQQVIAADMDGDGKSDIVSSCTDFGSGGAISIFRNIATSGSLSSSSFATRQDIATPNVTSLGLAANDLDGDGKVDLVNGFIFDNSVRIFKNNSVSGTISIALSPIALTLPSPASPVGVAVADIDGDNKGDIAVANGSTSATISIFRNFGTPAIGLVTGNTAICITSTTDTFKNTVSGGTWSLSNTTVATINPTNGKIFPITAGNDTAIYTVVCNYDTAVQKLAFHVDPLPVVSVITGTATTLCAGTTITLNDVTTGGTWSSTAGSIATVTLVSGTTATITGQSAGNATISYTVSNGCGSAGQAWPLTVNITPTSITGTALICAGTNTTLSSGPTGGTWSPSTGSIATVNSVGMVHGISGGNVTVSYTIGSCSATRVVTVSPGPIISPITGSSTTLCLGSTLSLSDATPSGTWRSASPTVASVNSSGLVRGNSVGNTTISYIVTNSCGTDSVGYAVSVKPVPGPITGASFAVCVSQSLSLSDTATAGTWSSSTADVSVLSAGGTVTLTGISAGNPVISYTMPGGCFVTHAFTVNALPSLPTGGNAVCQGSAITLSDADGPGSWSSSGPSSGIVTVGSSTGVITGVTPGTTNIVFTKTSTGCSITLTGFTVNTTPSAISGSTIACVGAVNTLSSSPTGGTWTVLPAGVASIDPVSGAVTGIVPGGATVTYSFTATGCSVSTPITVAPSPGAITGPSTVCLGGFMTLTDTPSTGVWSSSNPVSAPINALGIVSGATLGTTTISFTLPSTGCRATKTVTVTPPPGAITGATPLCPYTSITLSDPTTPGVWSSNNTAVAVVNASTGVVTGVSGGTALISYTLTTTGCSVFVPVTVHDAPTISGAPRVCVGYTSLILADVTGGVWASTDTNIAKVDTATGLVHGRTAGSVIMSYTTPTFGCFDTMAFTSYDTVVPSLTILASPVITLTGRIASVCQATSVTYTAIVTNGGPTPGYQWRVNGLLVGTGPTYTYTPSNNDSVSCKLTSSAICATPIVRTDYIKMNVITRRTPVLNLAPSIGGDTTCLGVPVTLNPNPLFAGSSPTYNWKVNGVNVGPGSTFTYVPANGDVITVVVHSSYVCPLVDTATDTLHLTVSPYVTPTVTLLGSDTACELYPTVFVASQTGGGTNPTYQFYINGSPAPAGTVSGTALAYMANTGDVVTVTMTSNFPCVTTTSVTSVPHTITVVPVPVPSISVSVSPGYILAPGMTATFIATPVNPGSNATYQWKRDGVIIPGATNLVYSTNVFAHGDIFTCVMTTNDICNHISVYGYAQVFIGDNVGVQNVNSPNSVVNIVPNPSRGNFTIIGNTGIAVNEEVTAEVTNMLGQVIYTAHFTTVDGAMDNTINLNEALANGMYILNLRSEHLAKAIHFELAR